jgi:tungstate transport system ATP-binding protein
MACHDRDLIALPGIQRLKLRDSRLELRKTHDSYRIAGKQR